ncbi:MAG: penicillin-binding protein 2, partial [Litorimonas sp.]
MSRRSNPKQSPNSDATTINRRTVFLGSGALGVFGVLSARLYYLQVTRAEDYRALSEDNRFNFNLTLPERGEIRDRFGEGLAVNRQDYRVELIPERTKDVEASLDKISQIISLSPAERERILKDVKENSSFVPVLLKDHLNWSVFSKLNIHMHDLAGIIPKVGSVRAYSGDGVFSHTLGYVGRAAKSDIEKDDDPLLRQPTFRIGKTGVEAAREKTLRGSSGRLKVEVNARGRIVREWPDPETKAKRGDDVYITIDAHLQRFAAEQFIDEDGETDSGGLAVIDIITGELRTLLSMPVFDGNLFVSGLTQADMNRMNNDPKRPQFNKV